MENSKLVKLVNTHKTIALHCDGYMIMIHNKGSKVLIDWGDAWPYTFTGEIVHDFLTQHSSADEVVDLLEDEFNRENIRLLNTWK